MIKINNKTSMSYSSCGSIIDIFKDRNLCENNHEEYIEYNNKHLKVKIKHLLNDIEFTIRYAEERK